MPKHDMTFFVLWLAWNGHVIGREKVKRHDMSQAITYACNKLKTSRGEAHDAYGFRVVPESLMD